MTHLDVSLNNSKQEVIQKVIFRLTIDNKLSFDSHVKNICRKINQKTFALSRISSCSDI